MPNISGKEHISKH